MADDRDITAAPSRLLRVIKRAGVLAMMFRDKGGTGAADGTTALTNLFDAESPRLSTRRKK